MADKVAVTGASGLVGKELVRELQAAGYEVIRLVRRRDRAGSSTVYWNPDTQEIDHEGLEGLYGLIHLAGENIASGRWTAQKKRRIRESRVGGTALVSNALASLQSKPRVLVSASAIGYYGPDTEGPKDESSAPGSGFLADVCKQWEAATQPAEAAGIRVVHARIGVVLASEGGALEKMKLPFSLGIGGKLGRGDQYMNWVALDDLVSALIYVLKEEDVRGPVNFVAPQPVTNAEFSKQLGAVMKRPAVMPVPRFALRLAMGEMADELLLGGAEIKPAVLKARGFKWRYRGVREALSNYIRPAHPHP